MDQKRGLIVLLLSTIFLCIIPAVAASQYSTAVFSGTTFSGTSIDVDDYEVIVTMNYQENRIFVDGGDDWASIDKFECGELKNIMVCFTNVTFDDDELRTFIELEINKTDPEISITRTISSTEFYAGEEQTLTITVENTKDIATDCTYYEDWGEEFEITDIEGPCSQERTGIIWKGYLDTDDTVECTLTLKAKTDLEKGYVGSLEYFNGLKMETEFSTELIITVEPVVEIASRVLKQGEEPEETVFNWEADDSDSTIGEEIQLAINITNMLSEAEWVDVDLEIQYPAGMEYIGSGSINYKTITIDSNETVKITKYPISSTEVFAEQYGNVLRWSGRLNNVDNGSGMILKKSDIFIPQFITKKSGPSNLLLKATFEDEDGRQYTYTEHIRILVENNGVRTILYINDLEKRFEREEYLEDKDTIDIDSLNEYKLKMQIENLNPYSELRNVVVEVVSNLTNFSKVEYDVLGVQKNIGGFTHTVSGIEIPYEFIFNAPRTETTEDYPVYVTITGLTEYGELFTNKTEFSPRINKFEDIQINHEFEKTKLQGDEDTLVTTFLKNNRVADIKNVYVTDYIDSRLGFTGTRTRKLNLKAEEEVAVYSYTLTAPRIDVESNDFLINTTVHYYDPDYDENFTHSEESKLTVEPKELDLTIDRNMETDDPQVGDIINIEYVVTNSEEEETITDIQLYMPMQEDFDIVGPVEYVIPKLRPGESITLSDKHKIRLKHNDTTNVKDTLVVYHDIYGTVMFEESGEESIDIDAGTNYIGPVVFVTREIPSTIYANHSAKIKLRVQNKGNEPAEVTVNESGEILTVTVPARSERTVDYSKILSDVGSYSFEPAIVTYEHQGETLTTVSDMTAATIEIKPVTFTQIEEVIEEETPVATEITTEIDEIDEEAEARKLSMKFMIQVLSILAVLALIVAYLIYKLKGGAAPPVLEE